MISRCIALIDPPRPRKAAASQSSSSGCVGFRPVAPKLFGLPAIPRPKCHCQIRLTITRAVRGFLGPAIQAASALRRPSTAPGIVFHGVFPAASFDPGRALRTPGVTGMVGENGSPPARIALTSSSPRAMRSVGMRRGALAVVSGGVRPS
jgi:hypothetical protein